MGGKRDSKNLNFMRGGSRAAVDAVAREMKVEIAEFASHNDVTLDRHMIEVVGGKALQNVAEPGPRAAAAETYGTRTVDRDPLPVKETVEQAFGGDGIIQQFGRGERVRQNAGRAPGFFLCFRGDLGRD